MTTTTNQIRSAAGSATEAELRRRIAELTVRVEQLQTALNSRVLIEQAKGVLAERHHTTPDQAFKHLRGLSRNRNVRLRELATAVIAEAIDPPAQI